MGLAWERGCLNSNKKSINFMPYPVMDKTTKAKLFLITRKAAKDHKLKFTSLIHLLSDQEYLYECFCELKQNKAAGIDNRTKESYNESEIRQAIQEVISKLKTRKYRPQPIRRVSIPKPNGSQRPLGIPTVIDKIIQRAIAKILETPAKGQYYEPRETRSNHTRRMAYKWLNRRSQRKTWNWQQYGQYLKRFPLPLPKITYALYCS